jgi:pimeloyl-ACP methyl ester carboxylesterase
MSESTAQAAATVENPKSLWVGSDTKLHVLDYGGSGIPVLLLHGLIGRASTWKATAEWLTKRAHVYALDQRGHGLSGKPDAPLDRDAMVGDIVTVIKELGIAPAVVIGHSMGAIYTLSLVSRHPEVVRAAIIGDTGFRHAERNDQPQFRTWLDSWPKSFATLQDAFVFFNGGKVEHDAKNYGRGGQGWYFLEQMEEVDGRWQCRMKLDHIYALRDDWKSKSYADELPRIKRPTLIVHGGNSPDSPHEEFEEMARIIPGTRLEVVPGAGHFVHEDAPERWQELVEGFLDSLD